MPGKKRNNWIVFGATVFIAYLFLASPPIGTETLIKPVWLKSLESAVGGNVQAEETTEAIPFEIGKQFGYFDTDGRFFFVKGTGSRLSLSRTHWATYDAIPAGVEVRTPADVPLFTTKERGYPYFADGKTFIVTPEQNSIMSVDATGKTKWRRDFPSPITCADASAGLSVFGMLDGTIEVLNDAGERVFGFEPGGSRLSVIVAVKLSPDGRKLVVFSGLDPQRFLALERTGHTYKVVHHEYVGAGFRRPIRAAFIGDSHYVAFESENGLTVYDIDSRKIYPLNVRGRVNAFEDDGSGNLFFCLAEGKDGQVLIGVELPDAVFMRSPFKSDVSFLARRGNRIYVSGASSIAAVDIETK